MRPRRPPTCTLFPYTTLFRSSDGDFQVFIRQFVGDDFHGFLRAGHSAGRGSAIGARRGVAVLGGGSIRLGPLACDRDRKSTRLNSSHVAISYAVFCLKKKTSPHTKLRPPHPAG